MSVDTMQQGMPRHLCYRAITSTAWEEPDKTGPTDISPDWDAWSGMQRRIEQMIELRAIREALGYMKRRDGHKKPKSNHNLIIVVKAKAA